ncbi:hypothetical protein QBC38DRAFT_483465 [Podospora fimiseda]|uniref:Major facilitator superfamily (MFS) profile domain-containing protein n=1 Tax=Podospora fimiseda TaxID=252190 RepID=A0AAN7BKS4_9PEZI|nr:hypothetical protein QBC38DRAFT_483465 [Podospora fimiseda]
MRGLVTVVFQFCITLGILFSAVITLATRKKWSRACYRVPIGFQFIWAVGLLVCLYWCPESPRWYYKIGQKNRAELAVIKLQRIPQVASEAEKLKADAGVKQEMEEIMYGRKHHVGEANVAPEEKDFSASRYLQSWKLCFKGPFQQRSCNLKRTLFGVCLMMFQQLTGVNFLFYFGAAFFKHHGFSNPFVLAVGLRAVNVISTLASFVVVPAVRRRALLMYGAAAMGLCQLTVGLLYVGSAGSDNEWMNIGGNLARPQHVPVWLVWTSMVFISLYIFAFATTWGPGAWSLLGDIFPMETRARAIGIATAFNWLTNAIVCFVTPLIVDEEHGNLGMKVFLVWSGCSFVAFGFVYFLVPETCGRTLEEVAFKFDFGARNVDDLSLEKGGRGGQVERIVSDWATILMEKEKEEDELKAKARAARAASKKWYSVIFNKDGSGSESGDSEDSDDDLKQKTERVGSTGSWWSAQTAVSDFRLPVYTQHANTEVSSGNSRVEVKYKKWNIFKKTVIKSFVDDEEGIDGSVSPKAVHKKE